MKSHLPVHSAVCALTAAFASFSALAAAAPPQAKIALQLTDDGLAMDAGGMGQFTLQYPVLVGERWDQIRKPIEKRVTGTTAVVQYDGGARIDMALDSASGELTVTPSGLPADAKSIRMEMLIDISYAGGGTWKIGDSAETSFPAEKPAKPHLYQANADLFTLKNAQGAALSIKTPLYSFQQLTDNREWSWETLHWQVDVPWAVGAGPLQLKISAGAGTKATHNAPPPSLALRLADEGLAMDVGGMGQFTLQYPVLVGERWDQIHKPIEKRVAGTTAAVQYDGGAHIDVALNPANGELLLTPSGLPADVKSIRMEMLIDFAYAGGGTWKIGDGTGTPFPAEKPAKPHLYQGNADLFTLADAQGVTLAIKIPPYSFQQLTDNREWNWKTFHWQFTTPCTAAIGPLAMKISSDCATAKVKPMVDRFGQTTRMDFPDKVKSEAELKADIPAEADYLASLHPPAGDTFGGLPGSREKFRLNQTGFFHVEKHDGRWLLVDPEGNAFFQLGVCAFGPSDDYTYFKGREQIYDWLPEHDGEFSTAFHPDAYWNPTTLSFHLVNTIRKYGQPYTAADYTARMIERVRKWGFNSAGAFGAGDTGARRQAHFPAVAHLPLATWEGFPDIPGAHGAFDPFSDKLRERCDQNFAKIIAPAANDPLIIGYFLNNEPLYEDIPRAVAALDSQHPCKRRLAQMLEEKYKTIGDFNTAWATTFDSFAAVAAHGLPVKTRAATNDMQLFTGLFLDAYFRVVTQTFHKYDQNHLLLGNRLQPGTINNEQLCRMSGKYLDVISFNYYTYGLDTHFLDRIRQWTGDRPMVLSEFYFSSPKDSGLPGGAKDVSSQRERGLAYRNYVEQAAALGYVIGIEWFTLVDQAVSGRWFDKFNGENANTGLIGVADRPWKVMLAEMMQSNYDIYKVLFGERPPFVFNDPRFIPANSTK